MQILDEQWWTARRRLLLRLPQRSELHKLLDIFFIFGNPSSVKKWSQPKNAYTTNPIGLSLRDGTCICVFCSGAGWRRFNLVMQQLNGQVQILMNSYDENTENIIPFLRSITHLVTDLACVALTRFVFQIIII